MSKKINMNEQGNFKSESYCGGPAPNEINACCSEDANAKAAGQDGCVCDSNSTATKSASSSCC
ncbi:hypothetical protein QFZ77_005253 [Paenibacillus sp. V4I3]|uniref:hypothetical protein n=1 Tax=Paenibacillus sp. V4I3 TaxID=3042305 RepID=UPI00278B1935|nr:hypothetical protein [Paenibacillus sp. V4I3]MDQ0876594.1 hypothetical protein [Paenibacillus sp. V4I3]